MSDRTSKKLARSHPKGNANNERKINSAPSNPVSLRMGTRKMKKAQKNAIAPYTPKQYQAFSFNKAAPTTIIRDSCNRNGKEIFSIYSDLRVIGYWLLVIGYWLLVIGYWLLVIGYWLLVSG